MAPRTFRPWNAISITSPVVIPLLAAVFGDIHTALSQVILFCGFGISCSQLLLDQVPSPTEGSGRSTISSPGGSGGLAAGIFAAGGVISGNALPANTPSCREVRQKSLKSAPACCVFQYARTV